MNKRAMKEYRIWKAMKARCYAPSQTKGYYKQNNIRVCDRWLHDFSAFIADMGPLPDENYSIERIDVKGDYCPENCKWIPMKEQPKNRNNSIMVKYEGKQMCLKDWARYFNVKYTTLYRRFVLEHMAFEEAVGGKA